MGDSFGIRRMLAVILSVTQTTKKTITQIRDYSTENGPRKITNWQFTSILGVTLHNEGREKELYKFG